MSSRFWLQASQLLRPPSGTRNTMTAAGGGRGLLLALLLAATLTGMGEPTCMLAKGFEVQAART